MTTTWISSAGGPLVFCTEAASQVWTGAIGSDYAVACSVDGYVGAVQRHGHQYLVLGDEPLETTVVRERERHSVVRWVYCDSESHAQELLLSLPEMLSSLANSVDFELTADGAQMFDSAASGDSAEELLQVGLLAGQYVVSSWVYAGPGFRFLVHRFTPKLSAG
jgi:hypothetical protein